MKRAVGLFALVTFVGAFTACVFDSGGDYKGGGRNPPVKKEDDETSPLPTTPAPTTPAPTTPAPTTPTPVADAAVGG